VRCRVLAKSEPHQRGAVRRNAARHRAIDELKLLLVEFQSHDGFIWHGRIPAGGCAPSRQASAANFAADILSDLPRRMQRSGSIEWLNSRQEPFQTRGIAPKNPSTRRLVFKNPACADLCFSRMALV